MQSKGTSGASDPRRIAIRDEGQRNTLKLPEMDGHGGCKAEEVNEINAREAEERENV